MIGKKHRMVKGQWYRGTIEGIYYEIKPGETVPDELLPYLKKNFPKFIEETGERFVRSPKDKSIKSEDVKKKVTPMSTESLSSFIKRGR